MTTAMLTRRPSLRAVLIVAALLTIAVGGVAFQAAGTRRGTPHRASSHSAASGADPTAKQRVAADLEYPVPTRRPGTGIVESFDAAKNRSRITLELRDPTVTGPAHAPCGGVVVKLISEFEGTVRRTDAGELSVRCVMSAVMGTPGLLAPSSPPAEFCVDGRTFAARSAAKGQSGYRSKRMHDGFHESLEFRIPTRDLLAMARSHSVTATLGVLTVSFSAAHLGAVREFAGRMDPTPPVPPTPTFQPSSPPEATRRASDGQHAG